MTKLNETHDPALRSFVASANADSADFPVQNLPFGVFRRRGSAENLRGGIAIGDQVLDLAAAHGAGLFSGLAAEAAAQCRNATLNDYMALGPRYWTALRLALSRLLRSGSPQEGRARACLVAQADVELGLPARIGDYSDFFASVFHATNGGRLFRPDSPLLPNYKYVPVAYHGRASSIRPAPHAFPRPNGQVKAPDAAAPVYGPTRKLDFELEMGVFVGVGNELGTTIPVNGAEQHLFGLCLLNDWSARDIQAWEYQPLGPFLGKSFATTISPWIVTLEALAPYRCEAFRRPAGDPPPLPHLADGDDQASGGLDIRLEAQLLTSRMRESGAPAHTLARTSFRHAYWTVFQMTAHQTSNGCNLCTGDLLGTGTMSGPTDEELGSLLELTRNGAAPIVLPGGESRSFLEDGDTVILRAWCEREGAKRIGFGVCTGTVTA